jgi:pilus assembly protein Flp/PilA
MSFTPLAKGALTGTTIPKLEVSMPPTQHATAANRILKQEDLIMLGLITKVQTRATDLKEFYQDKSGATAIEYGLIAAGIAVAIIAAVFALGDEVKGFFTDIQTQLENAGN